MLQEEQSQNRPLKECHSKPRTRKYIMLSDQLQDLLELHKQPQVTKDLRLQEDYSNFQHQSPILGLYKYWLRNFHPSVQHKEDSLSIYTCIHLLKHWHKKLLMCIHRFKMFGFNSCLRHSMLSVLSMRLFQDNSQVYTQFCKKYHPEFQKCSSLLPAQDCFSK